MNQSPDFKVLHISTSTVGGAGRAATSLHNALRISGIDSQIFYLARSKRVLGTKLSLNRNLAERMRSKLFTLYSRIMSRKVLFSIFSSKNNSLTKLVAHHDPEKTIIHFHNWFNSGNYLQFRQLSNMGFCLIFTLHDERFYTGGCHYAISCEGFKTECAKCPLLPQILNYIPKYSLKHTQHMTEDLNLSFIAPSGWIKDRANTSLILRDYPIVQIANYISIINNSNDLWIKENKKSDTNKLILGVASMDPFDPIKGGTLVQKLLQKKDEIDFEILLLVDYLDKDLFWQSIDYLLVASKIDNSPNVVHEAKLRGIPIITTAVGGIAEMLSEFDLILKDDQPTTIIESMKQVLMPPTIEMRNLIIQDFESFRQNAVNSHIEFYKAVLFNRPI